MTQANPLRVGLIGAGGRWGLRAHVPVLKSLAEAELYAVCREGQIFICGVRVSGQQALVALLAVTLPE